VQDESVQDGWPGTATEFAALLSAVERTCTCVEPCTAEGHEHLLCGPHQLFADTSALKRLIFYRRYSLRDSATGG
jgi:hypothetical protein